MVSVIVDNSGIIHVAGCDHGGALKYWKSDSAEDISAFTAQPDLSVSSTYTSWIKHSSGTLYNFHRQPTEAGIRFPWYFQYFNGSAWSGNIKIIEVNTNAQYRYACYPAYDPSNQKIWLSWRDCDSTESEGGKQSVKVYCAYLDVSGGATNHHMFSVEGKDLGASVTDAEANAYCLVTDGTDSFYVWQTLVKLDSSGNPYIMYPRSTDTTSTEWDTVWKYWTGSAWTSEIHVHDAPGWWTHLAFEVSSSTSATAYLMDENRNPRKKAWNGSAWSTVSTMPQLADIGASWGFQYVEGGQEDLKLMWDLNGVVVGLDSDDNPVPVTGFSMDAIRDNSPYAHLLRKAGATSPTEAAGSLGKAMSFNGTSDYAHIMSLVYDWSDTNGAIQVLAKTPSTEDISAKRCVISLNAENGDGRMELSINNYKLYFRMKPDSTNAVVCTGSTILGKDALVTPMSGKAAGSYPNIGWARGFTVPSGGVVVTRIGVNCEATGTGSMYAEVWTDSSGPGGLVAGTSVSIEPTTGVFGEHNGTLSTPIALSAGNYHIVVREWGWTTWKPGTVSTTGASRAYVPLDGSGDPSAAWTILTDDTVQYSINLYGYSGSTIPADTYCLLGMSQDATDGFKLWVNGAAESPSYTTGSASVKDWMDDYPRNSTDATFWYIGKRKDGATSDSYYSNLIDEIRFQSRQRTAAEWKADYHGMVAKDLITYGN